MDIIWLLAGLAFFPLSAVLVVLFDYLRTGD